MGMFPGTNFGTKTDEITIVVAHWDTVLDSPGFDDNGSGTVYILGPVFSFAELVKTSL